MSSAVARVRPIRFSGCAARRDHPRRRDGLLTRINLGSAPGRSRWRRHRYGASADHPWPAGSRSDRGRAALAHAGWWSAPDARTGTIRSRRTGKDRTPW